MSKPKQYQCDVLVVGGSMAGAACAKRLVDAGFNTIVLEKKTLPRHKICSGILSPRAYRFITENFGDIPPQALHQPNHFRGAVFHYPSMNQLKMDFLGGATPHLNRQVADHWILTQSGATIHDQTSFKMLEQNISGVDVVALKHGQAVAYKAAYVVAADGPASTVVKAINRRYHKRMPWFFVGNKFHEIIENPLDKDFFHFWFNRDLGHYTWCHERDQRMIVGVGFLAGANFDQQQQKVVEYLRDKHGVLLKPADETCTEGCAENFGPSLTNQYIFGQGRVLVTGQAAGFLNMLAEGMSCALHSGAIAGESIIEAKLQQQENEVQSIYRQMISSEVKRSSDQWNPLQMLITNPHEADAKKALRELGWRRAITVLWETWRFVTLYKPLKWGRKILKSTFYRTWQGHYSPKDWN